MQRWGEASRRAAVAQERDPPARKSAANHDEATLVSVEEEVFRGEGGGDESPGVELATEPVRAVLLAAKREPVAAVSADRERCVRQAAGKRAVQIKAPAPGLPVGGRVDQRDMVPTSGQAGDVDGELRVHEIERRLARRPPLEREARRAVCVGLDPEPPAVLLPGGEIGRAERDEARPRFWM